MASPDGEFPLDGRCDICGAELDDEIVVQEFADGSLARLCTECAAGTALEADPLPPDAARQADSGIAAQPDPDPLDMTKELLMPVVDLISLQVEVQAALERLAYSLETFATGVITENQDKTQTVEDRVRSLEVELELTRARLLQTEELLRARGVSGTGGMSGDAGVSGDAGGPVELAPKAEADIAPASPSPEAAQPVDAGTAWDALAGASAAAPAAVTAMPVAPPQEPVVAPPADQAPRGFRLEEVQAAQRYFNDSAFTRKVRDVLRSLGKPQVNLTRAPEPEPRAFITVTWNIVWYQYLVDMSPDIASDERVVLHREGMDLGELPDRLKEKNASIDDDGRLDASELEVRLLSDPSALITEMSPDQEQALEDATGEIWGQRVPPEFKWDD